MNETERVWERIGAAGRGEVRRLAERWRCDPAAILAVIEVESGGRVFAAVGGHREPLIRFEGHYFHARLEGEALRRAVADGLADPVPQAVANPPVQVERWAMLACAERIDARAARESCSWGLGQVMGAHWRRLGYPSVHALVDEARRGADGQIALMARFVEDAGLEMALRGRDWERFARAYNGPRYAERGYHDKLAEAYREAVALDLGDAEPEGYVASGAPRPPFGPAALAVAALQWFGGWLRR